MAYAFRQVTSPSVVATGFSVTDYSKVLQHVSSQFPALSVVATCVRVTVCSRVLQHMSPVSFPLFPLSHLSSVWQVTVECYSTCLPSVSRSFFYRHWLHCDRLRSENCVYYKVNHLRSSEKLANVIWELYLLYSHSLRIVWMWLPCSLYFGSWHKFELSLVTLDPYLHNLCLHSPLC